MLQYLESKQETQPFEAEAKGQDDIRVSPIGTLNHL